MTQVGLLYEPRPVSLRDLPPTLLAAAERSRVRHVLVVGARHEPRETVTLGSRQSSGRLEGARAPALIAPGYSPTPVFEACCGRYACGVAAPGPGRKG